VEASSFPSGLKARAMVDLGSGGLLLQYVEEQCRRSSVSAHSARLSSGLGARIRCLRALPPVKPLWCSIWIALHDASLCLHKPVPVCVISKGLGGNMIHYLWASSIGFQVSRSITWFVFSYHKITTKVELEFAKGCHHP